MLTLRIHSRKNTFWTKSEVCTLCTKVCRDSENPANNIQFCVYLMYLWQHYWSRIFFNTLKKSKTEVSNIQNIFWEHCYSLKNFVPPAHLPFFDGEHLLKKYLFDKKETWFLPPRKKSSEFYQKFIPAIPEAPHVTADTSQGDIFRVHNFLFLPKEAFFVPVNI